MFLDCSTISALYLEKIILHCEFLHCIDSRLVIFYFRYDHSAAHAVYVVISVLLFHFLVTGAVLATCCW